MNKVVNQKAWFFVLPVVLLVMFNAIIPLMTVVNFSVQETFGDNVFFWAGRAMVRGRAQLRALPRLAAPLAAFHRPDPRHRDSARPDHRPRHAAPRTMGIGLPRPHGAAAPHPVERRRRDVEHHGAARHRPARPRHQCARHPFQLYAPADLGMVHRHPHGRVALDVAGRAPLLRGPRLDPRRLLPGRQDRRGAAVGGLPLHPAPEAQIRADHRHPPPLHGLVHDLHGGGGADRRRARATRPRSCRSIWSRRRSASSTSGRRRRCR